MKNDRKNHIIYDVFVTLGMLALLMFICRLWPILLLIILGIFVAALRLLFRSSKRIDTTERLPVSKESEIVRNLTENDVKKAAFSVIRRRITEIVCSKYPEARWIWEAANAEQLIERGEDVFILLNRAGGYRRARVVVRNLQVLSIDYGSSSVETDKVEPEDDEEVEDDAPESGKLNYDLVAFEWTEAHIIDVNNRCNEAIGEGFTEIVLTSDELPTEESWPSICNELRKAGLDDVHCIPQGIQINLTQLTAERK